MELEYEAYDDETFETKSLGLGVNTIQLSNKEPKQKKGEQREYT